MYYLQSRYYDPEVCRFINSDDVNFIGATGTVNSYNAFAYCENNPVNSWDPLGYYFISKKTTSFNQIKKLILMDSSIITNKKFTTKTFSGLSFYNYSTVYIYNIKRYTKQRKILLYSTKPSRAFLKDTRKRELYMYMTYKEWLLYLASENSNVITRFKSKIQKALSLNDFEFDAVEDLLDDFLEDIDEMKNTKLSVIKNSVDVAEMLIDVYNKYINRKFKVIRKVLNYSYVKRYKNNNNYYIYIPLYYQTQIQYLEGLPNGKMVVKWKTSKTYYYL